jgi:hypothetical protein
MAAEISEEVNAALRGMVHDVQSTLPANIKFAVILFDPAEDGAIVSASSADPCELVDVMLSWCRDAYAQAVDNLGDERGVTEREKRLTKAQGAARVHLDGLDKLSLLQLAAMFVMDAVESSTRDGATIDEALSVVSRLARKGYSRRLEEARKR